MTGDLLNRICIYDSIFSELCPQKLHLKGKAGKMRVNASAAMFVTVKPDLGKLNYMNSSEKVDFELNMAGIDYPDMDKSLKGGVARILNNYSQWDTYREGGFSAISQEAQDEM